MSDMEYAIPCPQFEQLWDSLYSGGKGDIDQQSMPLWLVSWYSLHHRAPYWASTILRSRWSNLWVLYLFKNRRIAQYQRKCFRKRYIDAIFTLSILVRKRLCRPAVNLRANPWRTICTRKCCHSHAPGSFYAAFSKNTEKLCTWLKCRHNLYSDSIGQGLYSDRRQLPARI